MDQQPAQEQSNQQNQQQQQKEQGSDKKEKKKKQLVKNVDLSIESETHGLSQLQLNSYYEFEVSNGFRKLLVRERCVSFADIPDRDDCFKTNWFKTRCFKTNWFKTRCFKTF